MKKKEAFEILNAKIISVSEHLNAPYTIEIKTRGLMDEKDDSLTVDPRCTFYKDDKRPKTIKIVKTGDKIEATYLVSKGIKVAFNIIVLPEPY